MPAKPTRPSNPTPPSSGPADAVDEIVRVSQRKRDFGVRLAFLQQQVKGAKMPGPARHLVSAGDRRGLLLYLLLITKASAKPWDAALPAPAWARALGVPLPESKTARSTVSKIWMRLERHGLVERRRKERLADVFLLNEDGGGAPYEPPGSVGDRYFRVPLPLWTAGPDPTHRWYEVLDLPELIVLLIGRSLGDDFRLPAENGPEWYGVSADTISRGVLGLQRRGLLSVDKTFKKAPLSAVGYTAEHRYTLMPPFGPVGRRSGARAAKARSKRTTANKSSVKRTARGPQRKRAK